MHSFRVCSLLLLNLGNVLSDYSPFFSPYIGQSIQDIGGSSRDLLRRQNICGSGFISCASFGGVGACCKSNAMCALDQAGHVACCPVGSACTGTINAGSVAATGLSSASTMASSQSSPTTKTPSTTGNSAQITGSKSTVQNPYFPFVYLPTTFSNAADCSSSFSSCATAFTSCTSSLGGGANGITAPGVTITGPGVGATAQSPLPSASAASICSSLSTQACYPLQLTSCPMYGTAGETTPSAATFVAPNAAPTMCAALYGIGAGIAVGLAGHVIG